MKPKLNKHKQSVTIIRCIERNCYEVRHLSPSRLTDIYRPHWDLILFPEGLVRLMCLLPSWCLKQRDAKLRTPVHGSLNRQQLPRLKEQKKAAEQQQQEEMEEEEEENEEDMLDYHSDFESESRTEPDHSASLVSEHLQGHGDEEEVASEVRDEASDSDMSRHERTEDDYSSNFSDANRSYTSRTSDHSPTVSRSRDPRSSRSSVSRSSQSFSRQSRRRASARTVLKEAAVQTQTDPLAYAWPTG